MKNVHMRYKGVTEGKFEEKKKAKRELRSILIFIYTIHFVYLKVKSLTEKYVHMYYIIVTERKKRKI